MQQISAGARRLRATLLPAMLAIGSVFASLSLSVPASGPIAAVFPPWWDSARAMQAAAGAGRIAGFGAVPFVVILAPEPGRADAQLRSAGAWLLLDPKYLGGCTVAPLQKDT